jgi:hypothetical protein
MHMFMDITDRHKKGKIMGTWQTWFYDHNINTSKSDAELT